MTCPALHVDQGGLAEALRAIDCRTGEGTQIAFGRLFGAHGALMPALTILLTLYVALFAIGLLTGRTRLGLGALTPRMLTLGLALTFATSWLAYQNVVWTLATGAPDQIASVIAGTHGSATAAFADRLDTIFAAIADSTRQTPTSALSAAGATANGGGAGGVTLLSAQGMMWVSGLMLLVGTVGVLVTAKVALAALLALGPVFIILALFRGTRGLFEGWLKAVVSAALVPLFTVLIGGATIGLITPLIRDAVLDAGDTSTRSATALFLAACVYSALMVMVVRTCGTIVAGWRLPLDRAPEPAAQPAAASVAPPVIPSNPQNAGAAVAAQTVRSIMGALPAPADAARAPGDGAARVRIVTGAMSAPVQPATAVQSGDRRLHGVGSRFRAAPAMPSKARLS